MNTHTKLTGFIVFKSCQFLSELLFLLQQQSFKKTQQTQISVLIGLGENLCSDTIKRINKRLNAECKNIQKTARLNEEIHKGLADVKEILGSTDNVPILPIVEHSINLDKQMFIQNIMRFINKQNSHSTISAFQKLRLGCLLIAEYINAGNIVNRPPSRFFYSLQDMQSHKNLFAQQLVERVKKGCHFNEFQQQQLLLSVFNECRSFWEFSFTDLNLDKASVVRCWSSELLTLKKSYTSSVEGSIKGSIKGELIVLNVANEIVKSIKINKQEN